MSAADTIARWLPLLPPAPLPDSGFKDLAIGSVVACMARLGGGREEPDVVLVTGRWIGAYMIGASLVGFGNDRCFCTDTAVVLAAYPIDLPDETPEHRARREAIEAEVRAEARARLERAWAALSPRRGPAP